MTDKIPGRAMYISQEVYAQLLSQASCNVWRVPAHTPPVPSHGEVTKELLSPNDRPRFEDPCPAMPVLRPRASDHQWPSTSNQYLTCLYPCLSPTPLYHLRHNHL